MPTIHPSPTHILNQQNKHTTQTSTTLSIFNFVGLKARLPAEHRLGDRLKHHITYTTLNVIRSKMIWTGKNKV